MSTLSPNGAAPLQAPALARRMACWLYEGMLLFGVVFIAGYLFSALSQTRHALDNRPGLQAFLFLVLGIYFTQGLPLTQVHALRRYLASWLWFAPPLVLTWPLHLPALEVAVLMLGWVAIWAVLSRFHPQRQFWHDALAGTRLISSR